MENPMKMDDLGVRGYPIFGNTHIFGNLAIFEAENLEKVVVKRDVSIHHCVPSTNRMLLKQSTCEELFDNLSLMGI